ncbi:hypothetical protein BT93_K2233 [Corymbia citriodora subsp. variegata]|nr:hypothetical protein BT93_K2233 [Corymbia citriodora subsp. variegata]
MFSRSLRICSNGKPGPIQCGTLPEILFSPISKISKFLLLFRVTGISPWRLLLFKCNDVSPIRFPKEFGMTPDNLLDDKSRDIQWLSFQHAGISPTNLFLPRCNSYRSILHNEVGIGPLMRLSFKFKEPRFGPISCGIGLDIKL